MNNKYLEAFCNSLSNDSVINNYSFFKAYHSDIKEFNTYLQNEILENLANSNQDSRQFYFSLLHNKISNLHAFKFKDDIIDKWLKKYNVSIEEFPNFSNQELIKSLKKEPSLFHPNERSFIEEDMQLNFFWYFAKKEANSMMDFIENLQLDSPPTFLNKIKWIGKPSQLGFIISSLANLGYIEAPLKKDGEINYSQFSKLILQTFDAKTTTNSLQKYLNLDSDKGSETVRNYQKHDFNIPHTKLT